MKKTLIMITLVALTACAPRISIHTDFDKAADFKQYKTFNWSSEVDELNKAYPMYDNTLNRKRIKNAIQSELTKRNYQLNDQDPDLLVDFHILVEDKSGTVMHDMGRYRYWRDYELTLYEYKQGTLVIHLVDGGKKQLVWQGSATAVLDEKPTKVEEKINITVAKIFEKYQHSAF
ncbi:DUF4136 domain-containing protein [Fulvivirgaceae bacterium BMA10]|uniref:DUF4136 domain-containing protein n=1 Tax=Splendidivirga corallicola TaxID=3051826 RepID=A0ABT8KWE5_9BACT|nr:DUF4136 domain-containing protein [Fulvivirgaceae bacterium BMA10]